MLTALREKCPFEILHGYTPNLYLDLAKIPTSQASSKKTEYIATTMAKIQEVKKKLEQNNTSYTDAAVAHRRIQVFNEGDLVWVFRQEERHNISMA